MPDADGPAPPACRNCGKADKVDAKSRCWRCCDRPCSACGRLTGTAFVELCFACGHADTAEDEVRTPAPTPDAAPPAKSRRAAWERWILVVEVEPGEIPAAVRIRQHIKSGWRRHGLRTAGVPLKKVPEEVDVDRVEDGTESEEE